MSRADRVAGRLEDVDALLVTEPANLRYVTGLHRLQRLRGRRPRRAPLRDRLPLRRAGQGRGAGLRARAGAAGAARRAARASPAWRLGFDDAAPVGARRTGGCGELLPRTSSWCPPAGVVEDVRAVKEPGEILRIARRRRAGRRDLRLAARGRARRADRARRRGRAGARDARARRVRPVVPVDRRLRRARRAPARAAARRGDRARTRWSRSTSARCSTATARTARGRGRRATCSDELAEAYALVLRAQVTALDAVRPGPLGREIDAIARDIIAAAGHGEHFGHGLGHGVGLVTHEAPRLARSGDDRARGRATSSRSSRASTCRASAACGSRISWSSPRAAATSSRTPRRSF